MLTALLTLVVLLASAPQTPAPQTTARPTAAYYFLLGRHLEGQGKIDEAIAAHRQAIQLEPGSAELHAELGGVFARQDRAAEAVDECQAAIALDPANQEANRILGSVYAALAEQKQPLHPGDDVSTYAPRAIASLEIARRGGNEDLNVDLSLARLYIGQKQAPRAVPLLRRIVDEQPGYAEGSMLLAQAQEQSGDGGAAMATLKDLVDGSPTMLRAIVQLAQLQERQHRWKDAASSWERAQALSSDNSEIAGRRATALLNADETADATTVLQGALKTSPNDPTLLFLLAQAQREAGDLPSAEATARSLTSANPDDVRGMYVLGQILEAQGKSHEVVDLLTPEIDRWRKKSDGDAALTLLLSSQGLAYQDLKQYDQSIAAFKEAAQRAPNDPVRQAMLIEAYTAAGRHADALSAADAALRRFPDDTGLLFQLGAAQDRAGHGADAEKTFRGLVAQDPLNANALNYLGYMLAERGANLPEAVDLIQQALKVEPDNPSFLDSLGWAYLRQGNVDLADDPISTAAARLPRNSVVQDHLGDLRLRQRRPADAIAAWQRALAGDGDSIDRVTIEKKIKEAQANPRPR